MINKKYTFDLKALEEKDINIEDLFTLISLNDENLNYRGNNSIEHLQEQGFIKVISENNIQNIITREKGKLLLEELLTAHTKSVKTRTKRSERSINNELDEFIVEYRNLWKGLKAGSQGSLQDCRVKMHKWMANNPQYNKEDILKSAKSYIKSVEDYKYLQNASYFIYKQDHGGESSRLSAHIDDEEPQQDNWTSKLS